MSKAHRDLNPETLEPIGVNSPQTKALAPAHHHHTHEDQISSDLVAYGVGQVEIILSHIANKNDVPAQQYARRCLEHFFHQARR